MRTIILSYDYEIFFGDKSGTIERSLIVPTNFLLDKMDELGIKGNFFIDYLMLKCLRKIDTERTARDIQLIETQIKDIVRRGHRIELHLHPHWLMLNIMEMGHGTFKIILIMLCPHWEKVLLSICSKREQLILII